MTRIRLRQIVLAAESLETAETLQTVFGLKKPYHDPGVAEFGLENAVFAVGDQFIEVIAPTTKDAPARRFLDRNGEGGYMAIFQIEDLAAARSRLDNAGIRRVWNIDLEDIAASHLHPADVGAAIVSLDEAHPWESWRWAGPDWTKHKIDGEITGCVLESRDPELLASRWAAALGLPVSTSQTETRMALANNGVLTFQAGGTEKLEGACITLKNAMQALERADRHKLESTGDGVVIGGLRFILNNI